MKCIIAGSRNIFDYSFVESAIRDSGFTITTLITDASAGTSSLGYRWAYTTKTPIRAFKPDWNGIGKAGGHVNNFEMCANADVAIIVWDGVCGMTASLLKYCKRCQVGAYIVQVDVASLVTQGRADSTTQASAQSVRLRSVVSRRFLPTSRLPQLVCTIPPSEQSVGLPLTSQVATVNLACPSPTGGDSRQVQMSSLSDSFPPSYTAIPTPACPSPSLHPQHGP